MEKRYQIFVSSTYRDLSEHRQLVIKSLMQVNAIPAGMEQFPASDADAWELIQRAIDESDYYVVLIGGRYGSCDDTGLSFTEREYDYADEKGLPIMAFLHREPEMLPRSATEADPVAWGKLQIFREKAEKRHCRYWEDDAQLVSAVLTSYHHLIRSHPAMGWVRGDQAKTVQEVERALTLERRVAELQAALEITDKSGHSEARFANMPPLAMSISWGLPGQRTSLEVTLPWHDVFSSVAGCAAKSYAVEVAEHAIIRLCRDTVVAQGDPETKGISNPGAFVRLDDEGWERMLLSLVAFDLIEFDLRPVTRTRFDEIETNMERFVKLTPLGKRFLLSSSGDTLGAITDLGVPQPVAPDLLCLCLLRHASSPTRRNLMWQTAAISVDSAGRPNNL